MVTAFLRRQQVIKKLDEIQQVRRDWIRKQVLKHNRIDILATEVLGYEVMPHHMRMLAHQYKYPEANLALAWRGSGKTCMRTIARAVYLIAKNPNVRILIASKSAGNAKSMLSEIKNHLASDRFESIFGPFVGPRWDESGIIVLPRTSPAKEPTVSTVGVESTVISKHYDAILADDIVDEESARTAHQRNKTHVWWYKTMLPCLEPGGELSVTGTAYHYLDLYEHLRKNEMAEHRALVIPALEGNDETGYISNWPDKFTVDYLLNLKRSMGSILFDTQYQCDTKKMKGGGIIDIDYCQRVSDSQIPEDLPKYMGIDLAVSLSQKADRYYIVVIAYDKSTDRIYVVDKYSGRRTVRDQRRIAIDMARRHKIVRGVVESNQYQAAFAQELKSEAPDIPIRGMHTKLDKTTRAWRLAGRFEDSKMFFRRGLDDLIEELVLFPNGEHDDGFDALDLAIRSIGSKQRRQRREPSLL